MSDTAPVHTEAVTPDTDAAEREAAARTALAAHKDTCAPCRDVLPCTRRDALRAAWRQAVRELEYAPLNHAPAGGQTATTTGGSK